jgi:hypothetical protein|tara:strand:+ start:4131 stop:4310 length:180 start_codon:yes stop_codon:yes gene_type:complete
MWPYWFLLVCFVFFNRIIFNNAALLMSEEELKKNSKELHHLEGRLHRVPVSTDVRRAGL